MPLNKILNADLETQVSSYLFSFAWIPDGISSIYLLQGKTDHGIWHQIITNAVTDSDGEISIKLGDFRPNMSLTIAFGILAITDVKRLAVFVTNSHTGQTRKMLPVHEETKDLAKSETWDASFTFKTF